MPPWHLLLNSWAIFIFGRIVEVTMGWRKMLGLYFLSGIVGGLVQMAGMALLPAWFGSGAAVGASAGAFGLVAAFSVLYPRERVYLLLFFILPLRLRAVTLLWLCIGLAVFGMVMPLFANFLPEWLGQNMSSSQTWPMPRTWAASSPGRCWRKSAPPPRAAANFCVRNQNIIENHHANIIV